MTEPHPSYVATYSDIAAPRFGHAWRNQEGNPCASLSLGNAEITFRSSATADAVIAAVTEARDALAALEAEGPQQEGEPGA